MDGQWLDLLLGLGNYRCFLDVVGVLWVDRWLLLLGSIDISVQVELLVLVNILLQAAFLFTRRLNRSMRPIGARANTLRQDSYLAKVLLGNLLSPLGTSHGLI